MAYNPHFALPFRLSQSGAVVNEQDTIDDIAACVTAIISTHIGWREQAPNFGIVDLPFRRTPIGSSDIFDMIAGQEPRALMIVEERPDAADTLVDIVSVGVSLHSKGNNV